MIAFQAAVAHFPQLPHTPAVTSRPSHQPRRQERSLLQALQPLQVRRTQMKMEMALIGRGTCNGARPGSGRTRTGQSGIAAGAYARKGPGLRAILRGRTTRLQNGVVGRARIFAEGRSRQPNRPGFDSEWASYCDFAGLGYRTGGAVSDYGRSRLPNRPQNHTAGYEVPLPTLTFRLGKEHLGY